MISIDAQGLNFDVLNRQIRQSGDDCQVNGCLGQRFIATGMNDKVVTLYGTPGNALGAYLNGATIVVKGNAQDAVGDTMNDGKIIIHGNIGDAAGYAMRGGTIYVKGNAGYRAGIHMKAYKDKVPVLVIGGSAGSFLGEYQAGGVIIALGLDSKSPIVGNFPCTGMHGGKMLLRSDCADIIFPTNVHAKQVKGEELQEFLPYLDEFCKLFGYDTDKVVDCPFTLVEPDSKNPYKQMYVMN
ncbi:MAG: glutamate synthase [Christensenellales bacterium]